MDWLAARVISKHDETPRVRSIVFECPMWGGHMAGQHVDIRLTAEDGYQAQRSYSIASAPEDDDLILTIERLQDGEVSPYLFDELAPGDELEMRGPIGRHFAWTPETGGPLLMIAGGSGVVPFRAMLRHRLAHDVVTPARLVYSARTIGDVIYREELDEIEGAEGADVVLVLTRGPAGGLDRFRPPHRRGDPLRGGVDAGRQAEDLCLRANRPSSRRSPTASSTSVTNRSRSGPSGSARPADAHPSTRELGGELRP